MRRFYLTLILLLPLLGGCQKLVRQEIDSLQEQIDLLQGKVASANGTLESIRQLLTQMENGGRIKSAVPVSEDGRNGYLITFNDGRTIRIWSGKDGAKGEPGPEARIAVKAGEDGLWYWTLDGEWLKDSHGNRIRVTGDDGTSPVLKIEDGDWFISYGDGWARLGKAVGDDGDPGGEGLDGEDAASFFKSIEKEGNVLILTFLDGTQIRIPTGITLQMGEEGIKKVRWNSTYTFPYTVTGADANTVIAAHGSPGFHAEAKDGTLTVKTPADGDIGTVTLFAADGCGALVSMSLTLDPLIEFKDAEAKRICLDKWDLDKDGELSLLEARQATSIFGGFDKNDKITSFDELRYFKSLSVLDGDMTSFFQTPALVSVTLPSSIQDMSHCYLFFQQSGLQYLTVLAVTPPILCAGFFGFAGTGASPKAIYVPDESVELYKAAEYWKDRAKIIKPLSEKTN